MEQILLAYFRGETFETLECDCGVFFLFFLLQKHFTLVCFHFCSAAMAASLVHATVSPHIADVGRKASIVPVLY